MAIRKAQTHKDSNEEEGRIEEFGKWLETQIDEEYPEFVNDQK